MMFSIGNLSNAFRHADPEVDHTVGHQLEGRPPGDDLSGAHFHRWNALHGHPDLTTVGRIIKFQKRLPVVFGFGHHDAVNKDSRDLDLAGIERPPLGYSFHLHDGEAARIPGRHRHGERFQSKGLLFHGDIPIGIVVVPLMIATLMGRAL